MTAELYSAPYARLIQHSASRASLVIAFVLGLAEATIFFIVPDVYLGFVVLFNWRNGLRATVVAVSGALVGGTLMYLLAATSPLPMNELLVRIPLISTSMLLKVAEQTQREGLLALVTGPLQGIPYKVYAVQAGEQQLPLLPFLLITIPARLERILPVALFGAVLGVVFKKFIRQHTVLVTGVYALIWLGIYLLYFLSVR